MARVAKLGRFTACGYEHPLRLIPLQARKLRVPSSGHCIKALDNVYDCAYNTAMDYQWDPRKARINQRKHGVDFADAVSVLEDDFALTIPEETLEEERFVTIGCDALGRILVVVYTYRADSIRIISARKATARERSCYEERDED